ncbi:isocitrate/isopropylmalate dehydrogenase family protein [Fimbriimonas ginsengisoli]|uniref:Isopropylmalate/isohomocitrate dehydrogenase n=1 Tax=Fimbriimonas ginsengisoli Gsoil 348 TaxID=661478 RepID=A0A068NTR4_FIMGI|nr:isocitrate/isopropylmalate family dehydrogenase [Fimbriimonas ginsengisoli]AIE86752.1 isopropylmalate/isohomocitrate dehydrogenase [Fimbriimonas ginsengisoli Gsoil 348]
MSQRRIAIIRGDGIGPEIMDATLTILEAGGFTADYVNLEAGLSAVEKGLPAMPPETVEAIREIGIALKSPTTTPVGGGHVSANVALRKALDLFANVRPTRSIPGVKGPFEDFKIDLIIVRENTEDLYAGIEFQPHPDMAQAVKVITRPGSNRLHRYAFDMVRKQGRKKLAAVHKANIMKLTDGMFLEEFYKVAKEYPDIHAEDIIVDNCCMQLVTHPERFDAIVTENLYGDIVSDLCAGLVGGLGLAAGANIGEKCAVFEAVHGSAPDIAGKGIANPTALLFSALMMLRHIGENDTAKRIGRAVLKVAGEGKHVTRDLGGTAGTAEYTDAIIAAL